MWGEFSSIDGGWLIVGGRFRVVVGGLRRFSLDIEISGSLSSITGDTLKQEKYDSCSLNVTSMEI